MHKIVKIISLMIKHYPVTTICPIACPDYLPLNVREITLLFILNSNK